jgi:CRISPR-associated protein Cmr6
MQRNNIPENNWENPGLFFDRGFKNWNVQNNGDRGKDIRCHIDNLCKIPILDIYRIAFNRWQTLTGNTDHFAIAAGKITGRLFIGLGMPHVLETQVTRNQTYGTPCIPGSALKGVARACALKDKEQGGGMTEEVVNILFGNDPDDPKIADAGYLIFHDAWWIPDTEQQPYVAEVVTVHTEKYYQEKGKKHPHPDLESPNPNNQVAVQGRFYFVIEGKTGWAELGMRYLKKALEVEGIGGKISSGYGYFSFDQEDQKNILRKTRTLFAKSKELQASALSIVKKQLQQKMEAKQIAKMQPYQRVFYKLEKQVQAFEQLTYLSSANKMELKRLAKQVMSLEVESATDIEKEQVVKMLKKAYRLSFNGRKLQKKISKVLKWSKNRKLPKQI